MQTVVPALRVRSYAVSREFYAKLGFEEEWTHRFEPHLPCFASITNGAQELFLTEHTGDCQFGALVHLYVDDVDDLHSKFVAAGVAIEAAPNNDLGPDLRIMSIQDPDGNRLKYVTQS